MQLTVPLFFICFVFQRKVILKRTNSILRVKMNFKPSTHFVRAQGGIGISCWKLCFWFSTFHINNVVTGPSAHGAMLTGHINDTPSALTSIFQQLFPHVHGLMPTPNRCLLLFILLVKLYFLKSIELKCCRKHALPQYARQSSQAAEHWAIQPVSTLQIPSLIAGWWSTSPLFGTIWDI